MTKHASHHPHTFVVNLFGAVGYVAMAFVWLLVCDLIVILASLGMFVQNVSTTIGDFTTSTYVTGTAVQSGTAASHMPLKFLLSIVLLVLIWIFGYLTAKVGSKIMRHFLALFGRKTTLGSLVFIKYLFVAMGLIGLIVLLQFVPAVYGVVKFPIAFLGLVGGVVAVGSIWAQKELVTRYRLAIERVL